MLRLAGLTFAAVTIPFFCCAATRFHAEKTVDDGVAIVRLSDMQAGVELSIVPALGNRAYQLKVHGQNLLYAPGRLSTFQANNGKGMDAVPFLAPWGNRIPGGGFWANGKRYLFNPGLNNINFYAPGIAIHGLLTSSPLWEVERVGADRNSAFVTSRLQFWKYPDLMANWPFAHEYRMTYTLSANGVQVNVEVSNLSADPMPLVIGFHPYFTIPGVPRAEWTAHIPAKKHVEMDSRFIATGEFTPSGLPDQVSLLDHTFDDGYTDLSRDADGRAIFSIAAANKKIEVAFGPLYKVALVFAPPKQEFLCFEPMAAITNAVNLAHDGKYAELQSVAPNAVWRESFWIRFTGF